MSFWQLTQVIGSPPQSDFPSVPTHKYANAPEKVSSPESLIPRISIPHSLLPRRRNVARLGQAHVLQLGLVGAEGIHGRNAPDRRIQLLEEFVGDARRDLRAYQPKLEDV